MVTNRINPTGAFSTGGFLFAKVGLVVFSIIRDNALYLQCRTVILMEYSVLLLSCIKHHLPIIL
jgi:hypothetical protein